MLCECIAVAALSCYAFYVPLSIMITPMLLEAPRPEDPNVPSGGGVTYLKLYLMAINVIKSIMLLVTVLGPQTIVTTVLSSTVSSVVLGAMTLTWFYMNKLESKPYSAELHPCNIAFINYWKAASYTASVVSAIIISIAYNSSQSAFPINSLTGVLVASWVLIIVVFSALCYIYYSNTKDRSKLVDELIQYPFYWRDLKDTLHISSLEGRVVWFDQPELESKLQIPGYKQSPWLDYCKDKRYDWFQYTSDSAMKTIYQRDLN